MSSRHLRTAVTIVSMVAGSAVVGDSAHAQPWLPDRAYTEGPGIRAGDFELHPGVAVRGGYDTNVFRANGDHRTATVNGQPVDVTQRRQGAGILSVTPHLYVSTLSALRRTEGEDRENAERHQPKITFRGGAAATYYHYFIDNGPRNVGIDTDMALGIMPQRPFNLDVALNYIRSVTPFTQNAFSRNAYNYDAIQPRLRANFGSRSQVVTGFVGYAPRITQYESSTFRYLSNNSHNIEAGAAYRFLPSTALVYDGEFDLQDYSHNPYDSPRTPVYFQNNKRLRSRAGLNGALTNTLSLRGLVGYSMIRFAPNSALSSHEDVIAEVQLAQRFGTGKMSEFIVGFQRDVSPSALGGWARVDRGSMAIRGYVGRLLLLSLEGGLARVDYGRLLGLEPTTRELVPLGANNTTHRKDVRVDGAFRAELRATNWLSFLADVSVQAVVTDFQYALRYTDTPIPDPARFWTLMAFGGMRAHY